MPTIIFLSHLYLFIFQLALARLCFSRRLVFLLKENRFIHKSSLNSKKNTFHFLFLQASNLLILMKNHKQLGKKTRQILVQIYKKPIEQQIKLYIHLVNSMCSSKHRELHFLEQALNSSLRPLRGRHSVVTHRAMHLVCTKSTFIKVPVNLNLMNASRQSQLYFSELLNSCPHSHLADVLLDAFALYIQ